MIDTFELFRFSARGLEIVATPATIDAAAAALQRRHCILVRNVLSPSLAEQLVKGLAEAQFHLMVHHNVGSELCATGGRATSLLELATNRREVFEFIQRLSGIDETPRFFEGRIYRFIPAAGHYDSWHDDVGDSRRVAMSINLSDGPYVGGTLTIRDKATQTVACEAHNVGFGDALMFRVDPLLAHRVSEVTGTVAKTAYAGWFRTNVAYAAMVKDRAMQSLRAVAGGGQRP
jgi:2-oxoglutarate-Fe(II)-dependent oxygenase superfamily protein